MFWGANAFFSANLALVLVDVNEGLGISAVTKEEPLVSVCKLRTILKATYGTIGVLSLSR
jgi:hypothetical protein